MIKTSGGVHVMVKKEKLNFNPNHFTNALKEDLRFYGIKEIERNRK